MEKLIHELHRVAEWKSLAHGCVSHAMSEVSWLNAIMVMRMLIIIKIREYIGLN